MSAVLVKNGKKPLIINLRFSGNENNNMNKSDARTQRARELNNFGVLCVRMHRTMRQ